MMNRNVTIESGFYNHLGFEMVEWREGLAILELNLEPYHLNRARVLHGGVLTSMIDIACGFSGCFCAKPDQLRKAVTLSLTTSFTGQVNHGKIQAVGHKKTSGRKIFVATAEITSAAGEILAIGEGTYRYRSGSEEPTGEVLSSLHVPADNP